MRRVALGCLLATAGLAVVSAATALSTRAPEEFNQTLTLAGGPGAGASEVRAPVDDPDAPIATARYGGERSRVAVPAVVAAETHAVPAVAMMALAGGPQDVGLAGAAPAVALAVATSRTPPPPAPVAAPAGPSARILAEVSAAPHRPVLALTRVEHRRPAGKILQMQVDDQPLAFTPMGLQSGAVKRLTLNASNLMSKASASAEDLRRGRWMLYAASSGKAYGLNLIRDTFGGWRNAGYSEEKMARFGSRQIGLGYRKGNSLISLSATRRKLNSIDYSNKDTVFGVSVSVRGR
ncbi:hypothetical protein [Caulobacter sp. FWC2]|uniref:hypothetical protein n=1 Tax=Caulobacter sp. FWC2 TaxID=69664 RepID=UPI000C1606C0|nr:hypothetical protein [Caulobacter sp. FWC2]PIB93141.1 hypothetical protein CSW62_17065 [Caulobacter sp. FWC2]